MKQALRGVNLGGWLALEPWITPSLFVGTDAPDEFTFCDGADPQRFHRLSQHRKTFVTEKDFQWLAEHDIKAVRIPVGYWIFGGQKPYVGSIDYLDRAFDWAEKYGLKVLVCLHGAPESQNGEMHSGRQGDVGWNNAVEHIDLSLQTIERLAQRYAGREALLGIELLNEPSKTIPRRILKDYYKRGYRLIRRICGPDTWVVFSDGFQLQRWAWSLHWPLHQQAYLDSHQYQLFTQTDRQLTPDAHLAKTKIVSRQLRRLGWHRHYIVGEWSAALPVEALEAYNETQKRTLYRQYIEAQIQAYTCAAAWFYWTYKTEDHGPWSFRDMQ